MTKAKVVIESKKKAIFYAKLTPLILATTRKFEGRRRWVKNKHLIFEPTGRNLGIIRSQWTNVEIVDETIKRDIKAIEGRPQYSFKTKPYPYQQEALDKMSEVEGLNFALFCEPGTGKTKMAIDRAGDLWSRGLIDSVIVVAPKGVHNQWVNEQLPIHYPFSYQANWWKAGTKAGFVQDQNSFYAEDAIAWWTINYDALHTAKGKEAMSKILDECGNFLLVLDESHNVKNARTLRWKNCNILSQKTNCVSRLLLTGTPIAKDLSDEWAQLKILDEAIIGVRYITHFRAEYCILGGFQGKQFLGPRNLKQFKKITDPYIYRARKRDLDGIPEKVYRRWSFSMTPKQKQMYRDLKRNLIAMIDSEEVVSVTNALPAILRLQQISNGYVPRDSDKSLQHIMPPTKNPRLCALEEILTETEDDYPVIIWCRFQEDVRMILDKFDNAVSYYGAMKDDEKKISLERWLDPSDQEARLFVATPGSGGTGLNLQKGGCAHAIYYSNSENFIQRQQSEDRIHRIGAKGDHVLYTDIVSRGSRDYAILSNLKSKKNLSELTLGDIKSELEIDFMF